MTPAWLSRSPGPLGEHIAQARPLRGVRGQVKSFMGTLARVTSPPPARVTAVSPLRNTRALSSSERRRRGRALALASRRACVVCERPCFRSPAALPPVPRDLGKDNA
ncbi:hypothetical protein COCON_G00023330 [Conger conger]|uniref:Uncharacterized protein n=1 Tax=Conger conger TaxID=82655 RepID=A0A9Q1I6H3_CONCO|nr:hypothetical protein COCON_G00023330 [Conger conger]